jgi:hypothetical protein
MRYYTPEEVEKLIPKELEDKFDRFMMGKTCGIVDGKQALYKHDVDKFLVRNDIEPLDGHSFNR